MTTVITVKKLSREYQYYIKPEGLLGSIQNLFARKYKTLKAVDSISFKVKRGEIVGYLGPNGAGKTTTLKMLSGVLNATSGSAKVLGHTPWERDNAFKRQIGIVFGQKSQLIWDLPPMETFLLNKEIYGISDNDFHDRVNHLASILKVEDILKVQTRRLSLGQRMKCELIAALVHNPPVLFLDEPTIGLDIESQANMREFIRRLIKEFKTTIILTSHYMRDIEELCERVMIINYGKIIYDGNLSKLVRRYVDHKNITLTFKKPFNKKELEKFGVVTKLGKYEAELQVHNDIVTRASKYLLSNFEVIDLTIKEPEIEEVIQKIFSE